ncbi:hypothetical protein J010_06094 [Cryptococcus neoformans]|nr:hypothetical protein C368_01818 [Cryptococcus neoformans var. grubii 125.91]OXG45002.1 hypothetical protein C355_06109 [Cryptococcus neoformans var. grubii Th84]OXH01893.1 hypothetical protein J010_06094 [Cryptococcus neoformans var. grubii]OXH23919.1 hypothetical protein J009_06075 [Cryptococcus neoformans var. grubii]OXH43945.1 hypothetical protein J004_06093 [Cryptococcus neoformans var. grubii]
MQEFDEREESPMPILPAYGILAALTHVKRQNGQDLNTFPIDSEKVTIGRDWDSDLRLYYSDVSKLHAEIILDLVSGQASLHVHGKKGVVHVPEGGQPTAYQPPSVIPLAENDCIIIRKKLFRFNYGPMEDAGAAAEFMSPVPQSIQPDSPAPDTPVRRRPTVSFSPVPNTIRKRASHRMSLVPADKIFHPCSPARNRRHSTLGLGNMKMGSNKSQLGQEVMMEEGEGDVDQSVIGVAEGEDGDKIYLEIAEEVEEKEERNPEPASSIDSNPFLTPQQKGKVPLRNTSAVPRTRKLSPETTEDSADKPALDKSSTPPPSSPHQNPQSFPITPVPVPAHVALSTPKGPATLRKALLLRSARKVWQETHATGVDGAIQDGFVETNRRKSTSPRGGRKSSSPQEINPQEAVIDNDVGMDADAEPELPNNETGENQLEWVYEDGQAEISFDSESSNMDSFDADVSLDIPGQSVMQLDIRTEEEEEYLNNPHREEEKEVDLKAEYDEYEEYEVQVQGSDNEDIQSEGVETAGNVERTEGEVEDEDEQDDTPTFLPATPLARPTLTNKFLTPQVSRSTAFGQIRRSLGPPVRLPMTPNSLGTFASTRTPGSLGKPSRRLDLNAMKEEREEEEEVQEEEDEVQEEEEEVQEVEEERKPMATPRRSAAAIAETKRLHDALATPRTLPLPPASGFKNPVPESRFTNLLSTPLHPALAPRTPEPESEDDQKPDEKTKVPSTPLDDLKKRLNQMRRQSVQRSSTRPTERRSTVGFVLPGTPVQRPALGHSASYTVAPTRRSGQVPRTPIFPLLKREPMETIASPDSMDVDEKIESPTPASHVHAAPSPAPQFNTAPKTDPFTPSGTSSRMLNFPSPSRTPTRLDSGQARMSPAKISNSPVAVEGATSPAKETQQTPDFTGLKTMFTEKKVAATPNMVGVKRLFGELKVSETPNMDGLKEMYEEEEEQKEEEGVEELVGALEEEKESDDVASKQVQEQDEIEEKGKGKVVSTKLPRLAGSTGTRTRRAAANEEQIPAPAKITRANITRTAIRSTASATASTSESTSRPSRRKAAPSAVVETSSVPEPTSRSSRSRCAPISEVSTGAGMSRSTRAKSTAEPEEKPNVVGEPPVPPAPAVASTRSRSTSARSTRKASVEAEEKPEGVVSKPTRGKKVLSQIEEQPVAETVAEKKSAPTRAKRAIPTASATSTTSTTTTARRVVSAPSRAKTSTAALSASTEEKVSVPTRRKGKTVEKENDETLIQEEEKPAVKRRATTAGGSNLPVASGRTTRSRK